MPKQVCIWNIELEPANEVLVIIELAITKYGSGHTKRSSLQSYLQINV